MPSREPSERQRPSGAASPTDFEEADDIEGIDFDNVSIDLDGCAVNAGVVWRW